jgi:predicted DNA repair protein MutK
VLHGIPPLYQLVEGVLQPLTASLGWISIVISSLIDLIFGAIIGALVLAMVTVTRKLFNRAA